MLADQDFKLIGGKFADFMEGLEDCEENEDSPAIVAGTPANHQNQNGLAEIKWHHIMNMIQN
eukprot:14665419-Ditylum_brightwellii.AAC.1